MKLKSVPGIFLLGIFILAIGIFFNSFAGAAAPKNDTVGYVDMEKLQNELPDFVKLKEIYKDKQSEFNYLRGYLYSQQQSAVKELEKKATAEKAGKSADEQGAIDKRLQEEVKKKTDELSSQLQQKGVEIEKSLAEQKSVTMEKVNKIIAAVAEAKKLTLVLDKNVRYYGGTDITQAVIDRAKKEEVSKTGKDAPKTGNK